MFYSNIIEGKISDIKYFLDSSMMVQIDKIWYRTEKHLSTDEIQKQHFWQLVDNSFESRMSDAIGVLLIKPA